MDKRGKITLPGWQVLIVVVLILGLTAVIIYFGFFDSTKWFSNDNQTQNLGSENNESNNTINNGGSGGGGSNGGDEDNNAPEQETSINFSCIDNDAHSYLVRGTCYDTFNEINYTDGCINSIEVREYYCNYSHVCIYEDHICSPPSTCISGRCEAPFVPPPALDSDGDGYSDEDEEEAGTNPHDDTSYPGGPLEMCANHCSDIGYAGATVHPSDAEACEDYGVNACTITHQLPFEATTYSEFLNCCCFDCIGL